MNGTHHIAVIIVKNGINWKMPNGISMRNFMEHNSGIDGQDSAYYANRGVNMECFNCVSFGNGKRLMGERVLRVDIVQGTTRDRECFALRKGDI